MKKIHIENVGPIINAVDIRFERFCILVGPQCSGKSTVAKILSYCMWLEKKICIQAILNDEFDEIKDFKENLESFHRIHDYISESKSVITFESDFIFIEYKKGIFNYKIKTDKQYSRKKVLYIPSDRNFISIKNSAGFNLPISSLRSFSFDWFYCREYYTQKNKLNILNLDFSYVNNKNNNKSDDYIVHKNGKTYKLPLSDCSSGAQSVVPLVVALNFYTNKYVSVYQNELSFYNNLKTVELLQKILKKLSVETEVNSIVEKKFNKNNDRSDISKTVSNLTEALDVFYRLTKPSGTEFIIEEPEQNLFPSTQCELISYIFDCCNNIKYKSSAIITTHSPYILSSINLLLLGSMIRNKSSNDENFIKKINKILPYNSVIDSNEIEIYEISSGKCKSLKDPDTNLISENAIDSESEFIDSKFNELYDLLTEI